MRRFDLQLCAAPEAVQGKKIVYLYRILSSATTKEEQHLLLQLRTVVQRAGC